VARI
jgi:hypothetical protein